MGKFKWHYLKRASTRQNSSPLCTVIFRAVETKKGPSINAGFRFNSSALDEHLKGVKFISPFVYECDEEERKKGDKDFTLFLLSKEGAEKNPEGGEITWYKLHEDGNVYCSDWFKENHFDKISPDLPQHLSKWPIKFRTLSSGQRVLQIQYPPDIRDYPHLTVHLESLEQENKADVRLLTEN